MIALPACEKLHIQSTKIFTLQRCCRSACGWIGRRSYAHTVPQQLQQLLFKWVRTGGSLLMSLRDYWRNSRTQRPLFTRKRVKFIRLHTNKCISVRKRLQPRGIWPIKGSPVLSCPQCTTERHPNLSSGRVIRTAAACVLQYRSNLLFTFC
jgi:hypothetical protein